jgi:hypothetical protein
MARGLEMAMEVAYEVLEKPKRLNLSKYHGEKISQERIRRATKKFHFYAVSLGTVYASKKLKQSKGGSTC